ncbi:N domain-containingdehydrogenase [Trichoderma arundinaceum]|uniref:N domain-containingdehydrogenase n=1 Tax=Trichoderma arundinaceum TaxID=490622 RepID=A0A395NU08_TRIAR|nr:N domain-containingdehydrogenase [Trichoderma arundinaceum]
MHIFISGATGRNGRLALDEALSRGHTVTVLARNPSSLPSHPNLTVVKGTATSLQDVQTALAAPTLPSAILTTINQRRTSENPFSPLSPDSPPDLLTSTAQILLSAIAATPFERPPKIVVNSLLGAGESFDSMSWPFRAVLSHSTMKLTIRDHNNMDKLIRDSGVPFVLARPARLTDGPAKGVKIWPDNGQGCGWNAAISRASVGEWMIRAAETNEWDGKSPVLTN